ncbi:hypothetical protein GGQ83_000284 [Roseococcus suduntuyensis]|uniref:DUF4412 domain-containing protein n=2 Tax=Roseococcus suduntuyensis TaxID=455361 RepID=A0A840A4G6_9PROT|nr:hypothetical protein [Roseococcus suduntuyensis]MBB3896858.1 hypothetical protein [Roseococcus suduntuyensis]
MTRLMPQAALAALLLASPALAQDRPQAVPTRDVTVTYQAPQGAGEVRMSWLAARGLMRMDMPGNQGWMVVGPEAGGGFVVMQAQRMIMDLPPSQEAEARRFAPGPNARFTREGTDRVANTPCTIWRVVEGNDSARVCLTADGVTLRAEAVNQPNSQIVATAIAYGTQDPARFQRPQGYQSFQLPPGMAERMPRGTALPPPGMPPRQ